MRELAGSLEPDGGESQQAAHWRAVYTSRQAPGLTLGPVELRHVPGEALCGAAVMQHCAVMQVLCCIMQH